MKFHESAKSHNFYDTFGTVMDVISRIGLVRALYMSDKLNLTVYVER